MDLARRSAPTESVQPGANAAAIAQRDAIAASGPAATATSPKWTAYGRGPLVGDAPQFSRVATGGHADLGGRVNHFAYDPTARRMYASAGQGGVWALDDGSTTWRSVGDGLPTQSVGGLAFSPANGGTLLVTTGNDVFGGGTTFAGVGAFRSTDGGTTWKKATGVPDGVNSFQVAVDPSQPKVVYAATGAGLFRSTDAGASYTNVRLPVSPKGSTPNCSGALPTVEGCFLANIVTDVVVRAPGGAGANKKGGAVIAAVGWRAGSKTNKSKSYPSYVESPGNGLYASPTGGVGSFAKIDTATSMFGGGDQTKLGRIELGAASGPTQNHDYLYAIVQNAGPFQGGSDVFGVDAPGAPGAPSVTSTYLKGIYSSADFGKTWTLMTTATQLAAPTTGTSLTGLACENPLQTYCPGIQAWYNAWIKPDPTRADAAGAPTRLTFGLEEVWQNRLSDKGIAAAGPTDFQVIASYTGGTSCLFLIMAFPACPTASGYGHTTLHPDQHDGIFVPDGKGGVTLYAGNDGGVGRQHAAPAQAFSNANWGRGLNNGFNTLMPYSAVMAKDGIAYGGLQDNGQMRVEGATGRQYMTHDGDGTWSAVDPDNSNVVYERQPGSGIERSSDGGKTWTVLSKPSDTFQFVNPFAMDPFSAEHLLDAGNKVWESTTGGSGWTQVFNLGTSPAGAPYAMSAIDVRSKPSGTPLPTGPHTPNFAYTDGGSTVPNPTSGTNPTDVPGSYVDHPFTIGAKDGDARLDLGIKWQDPKLDWDLYLYRNEASGPVLVASSTSGNLSTGVASESLSVANPAPGSYYVRVVNYQATGTFNATATFAQRTTAIASQMRDVAYVGFCGTCDVLNARPFDSGIATNVGSTPAAPLTPGGWHRAKAKGLPKRYITSIVSDPGNPKTVYVTLGGYSRRWLPVGAMGEQPDPGTGHVFKSNDAGDTFVDISGNLPDGPAESVLVYQGHLIVGTDVGVFMSPGTTGQYQLLGTGLPNAPVFTVALKPKAKATEPDTLYVATHGRGIYTYVFPLHR
ncbi:MAG: hypothetical protein JWN46_3814, partial [Acidimicrobiales bacterium]|nr:hypothetical protein [Acidimicrobiales bacterium]